MDEIKKLEEEILYHKDLYYRGIPEIQDHEFDALEEKLKRLKPDSYVLKLVGSLGNYNEKIKHDSKMLSLNKTYDKNELFNWISNRKVVSTYKIDGMTGSLVYKNGTLILAKTRGNGEFGEDILDKVNWISSIPKYLNRKIDCEVRGELYCLEKDFYLLSDVMKELKLDNPTSMRNIVAGIIGRKDHINLAKYLSFTAFDILGQKLERESQKYTLLSELNFPTPVYEIHSTKDSVLEFLHKTEEFLNDGDYQIDGAVFTFEDIAFQNQLGETSHHPRYKIAFKYQGASAVTSIKDIEWNISRNGRATPVALVEPVELSGATISRVSLHNFGLVKQFFLSKNDKIEIIRSGEVIPKFLQKIKSSNENFNYPKICPSCSSELFINDIWLECRNPNCPSKILDEILHFIQTIGIEDVSSKRLEEMIRIGLVDSIQSLYKLKVHDLLKLSKVKEKLANKIFSNIENSKNTTLTIFMASLGISGVSINKLEKIIEAGFDTVEKIKNIQIDQLKAIDSFADKSSVDFIASLKTKHTLIDDLLSLGMKPKYINIKVSDTLKNLSFCITGELSCPRKDIEKKIKEHGGTISSSVSKNTNYLVSNEVDSNSSKFKKAKELKIKIISEEELINLML